GRYRPSRPLQVSASKFRELCKSLPPSKQSYLDCFDVAEHGLCGAIRVPVFQRRDHVGVLLAVMQPTVLRERFALELDPGIAAADDLEDAVDADQQLIARGGKEPLMKLRVPMLELIRLQSLSGLLVRVRNRLQI